MERKAHIERKTNETDVQVSLLFEGTGQCSISSGIPFMDHMLTALTAYSNFDIQVKAHGDLDVDAHHTLEDIGVVLGQAFREGVGNKHGIARFGSVLMPMDEALVQVVLDISGRPYLGYRGMPRVGRVGGIEVVLFREFLQAFVNNAAITLHVDLLQGEELHHIFEVAFKALGRGLSQAVAQTTFGSPDSVPSTKGALD